MEGTWGTHLSPETEWHLPVGSSHWAAQSCQILGVPSGHCLAFFTMVPTAEMTVVLEPLALVVTVTTAGSVAVVVRMVGCAMAVTGMAESHLLFLFWASRGNKREMELKTDQNRTPKAGPLYYQVRGLGQKQESLVQRPREEPGIWNLAQDPGLAMLSSRRTQQG